jgi:hypothetical protein
MTVHLEFAKRHLKTHTTSNNILWSSEPKIEHFGLNAKLHVWRKPGTIPTVMFFSSRDWCWSGSRER